MTLSTNEAELVAATACVNHVVWMRNILKEIGHCQERSTVLLCDNNSTIKLSKNPIMHGRTKHIDINSIFEGSG